MKSAAFAFGRDEESGSHEAVEDFCREMARGFGGAGYLVDSWFPSFEILCLDVDHASQCVFCFLVEHSVMTVAAKIVKINKLLNDLFVIYSKILYLRPVINIILR